MELTGIADVSGSVDAALVARARSGDREAFAILVEVRADQVLRTARVAVIWR